MPKQWYVIAEDGDEIGPYSLMELRALVKSRELKRDQYVRPKDSEVSFPASRLKGLTRSKTKSVETTLLPSKPNPEAESTLGHTVPKVRHRRQIATKRIAIAASSLLLIVASGSFAFWLSRADKSFPKPVSVIVDPDRATARKLAIRAPLPRVPSVANLERNAPKLLPGLEGFAPAYSPCLTQDLKSLVFASMGEKGKSYELYLTSRKNVEGEFAPPVLIDACSSEALEAYPAISPNGLELIFVRGLKRPEFLVTRRTNREEPFGSVEPWQVPDINPRALRLTRPQYVQQSRIAFRRSALKPIESEVLTVERQDDQSFTPPRTVSFSNPSLQYFLAAHGLRAYAHDTAGIMITSRSKSTFAFGPAQILLGRETTGPIDGPIWVAPKEDVIVYCSPGPDQEPKSARKLWMVRF